MRKKGEVDFEKWPWKIYLACGRFVLVDEADYEWLARYRWCRRAGKHTYYAWRTSSRSEGGVKSVAMHREILGIVKDKNILVDHINGHGFDNRRCNIRPATASQNGYNRRHLTRDRPKGASWNAKCRKWQATIRVKGKQINLGMFETKREAAIAYNSAAKVIQGEFAKLNNLLTIVEDNHKPKEGGDGTK